MNNKTDTAPSPSSATTRNENVYDEELLKLGYEPSLRRNLSIWSLLIYGLLFFVPMAPVAVFGYVVNLSGGVPVLVYLIAAVVMGLSASSYREMALCFPTAGSIYGYVRLSTKPWLGFLAGWFLLLDYALMPALLTILAAVSLGHIFSSIPLAAFIIIFMGASWAMNIAGLQITTRIGFILLAIQLVVTAFFLGAVGYSLVKGTLSFSAVAIWRNGLSLSPILAAVIIAALSYLGFDAISTLNEEARGGGQAVGRATMILTISVTVLFCLQIWAASIVNPSAHFAKGTATSRAFYYAVDQVTPEWFSPIFTLTNAVVAIFACLVVAHAASARLIFAMGRDRIIPQALSKTNSHGVPVIATTVVAVVSMVISLLFVEHSEMMTSLVTFGALTGYVVLHIAVIWYFIIKQQSKRFFAHAVVPVLAIISLVFVLYNAATLTKLVALGWCAIGLVMFGIQAWRISKASKTTN